MQHIHVNSDEGEGLGDKANYVPVLNRMQREGEGGGWWQHVLTTVVPVTAHYIFMLIKWKPKQ